MHLSGLLHTRIRRLVVVIATVAAGAAIAWPLGPIAAGLLALVLGVLAKLTVEAGVDASVGRQGSVRAHDRADRALQQATASHESLQEARQEYEQQMASVRADLEEVRQGAAQLALDLAQARSALSDLERTLQEHVEELRDALAEQRRELTAHGEAHGGDETLHRMVDSIERVVQQWRSDRQLAPRGDHGPPEARLAEAFDALRGRLAYQPAAADHEGSAGLAVDE